MVNKRNKGKLILTLSVVFIMAFWIGSTAFSASVSPISLSGNDPVTTDVNLTWPDGCDNHYKYKIDPPNNGTYTDSATGLIVTIAKGSNNTISFDSNKPIYNVFVKGGSGDFSGQTPAGGNLFRYPDGSDGDTGLYALNNQGISHITFYFCDTPLEPETGSLKVYKFYDENENGVFDGESEEFLSGWEFTVSAADRSTCVGTTGTDGYVVFTGLAPGQYTVTETGQPNWESTTANPAAVYVVADETGTIYFGNVYTQQVTETVSLFINKNVIDEDGNTLNNDPVHKDVVFTITVNGNEYPITASSPVSLTGLPEGTEFTVSETTIPEGYELVEISDNEFTVSSGSKTVTITNCYEEDEELIVDPDPPGVTPEDEVYDLFINKNVIDEDGNSLNNDPSHKDVVFTITVNGTEYPITASSPVSLTGLPDGTEVAISETTIPEGYELVEISDNEFTVSSGSKTVTITNCYEEDEELIVDPDPPKVTPEDGINNLPRTGSLDMFSLLVGWVFVIAGFAVISAVREKAI